MPTRPVRPSAAADNRAADAAAEKLPRTSPPRLSIDLSASTLCAVKVKAALEGLTVRKYVLRLFEADGIKGAE
ncbi:MAG: hypothetical protein ABI134_07105 [Byssovorax sp.]